MILFRCICLYYKWTSFRNRNGNGDGDVNRNCATATATATVTTPVTNVLTPKPDRKSDPNSQP